MFARFVFALVGLALIPVLGLCSCSRDRTDEWAISEPTLVTGPLSISVSAADNRAFPLFTKMKFHGGAWTSLSVTSECRMNSKTFTDSFSLTSRDTLDLKSLWPRALTARFPDRDLQRSECDFKFVAANGSGSTHAFEIRGAKLETFVGHDETLNARFLLGAKQNSVGPISVKAEAAYLATVIDDLAESSGFGAMSEVSLVCGENVVKIQRGRGGSESTSESAAESMTEHIFRDLMATTTFTGQQICHFVASDPRADTNVFALSAEVPLRFTTLRLAVSAGWDVPSNPLSPSALEIRIENPNDESTLLSIPTRLPRTHMRIAYLTREHSLALNSKDVALPITAAVSGVKSVSGDVFSLAPHGVATLRLTQKFSLRALCGRRAPIENALDPLVGFRWGFDGPLVIRQLETASDSQGDAIYVGPTIENAYSYPASTILAPYVDRLGPSVPEGTPTIRMDFYDREDCLY